MSNASLAQETYLPAAGEEGRGLAEVYDFLAAHEAARGELPPAQYFLAGPEVGDQVQLPPEVYDVLLKVVTAMRAGLAVTVAPLSQKLTTQQAADLLGVSRPTLVKMLDAGRIPFEKVNSHRRLLLRDVLEFREERRREQYEALEATAVDLDDEDDLASTIDSLKEARRAIAKRRRQGQ